LRTGRHRGELPRGHAREGLSTGRVLLAGAAALALGVGIGRFAYTPVLPAMQEAAGFGAATAGWIAGWNYLGYLLGALAASLVAARGMRVEVLIASIAASSWRMASILSMAQGSEPSPPALDTATAKALPCTPALGA